MNVTCPHCRVRLNLPDDKVPKDRDTSFKCPKCKGAIPVKASRPEPEPAAAPAGTGQQAAGSGDVEAPFSRRSAKPRALVCMAPSQTRDQLAQSIRRLDFSIEFPKNLESAFDELEYHIFPLLVLDDDFDPKGEMIVHMNDMDMSLRRRICLVRVAQGVETANAMAALHGSVNFVLQRLDIDEEDDLFIEDMVNDALETHKRFYAVFNDSLKVVGKA